MVPMALRNGVNPTSITDDELKSEIEKMVKARKKNVADYKWWLIPTDRLAKIFKEKDI